MQSQSPAQTFPAKARTNNIAANRFSISKQNMDAWARFVKYLICLGEIKPQHPAVRIFKKDL